MTALQVQKDVPVNCLKYVNVYWVHLPLFHVQS